MTDVKTIEDAKEWLKENYENGGCKCPACGQHVELKERRITASMAKVLIAMTKKAGDRGEVNISDVPGVRGGDYGKLRYWGLIEPVSMGRWKVTQKGRDFVADRVRVEASVWVYNDRVRRKSDDTVNIRQVLGASADYDVLWP